MSITTEHTAGASSLDGEELTAALLHENETLIAENKKLRDKFWAFRYLLVMLKVPFYIVGTPLFVMFGGIPFVIEAWGELFTEWEQS